MKKQLLIGSALLLIISANSQTNKQVFHPTGVINMDAKMKSNKLAYGNGHELPQAPTVNKQSNPDVSVNPGDNSTSSVSSPIVSSSFVRFSGAGNAFGFLVSNQKALQYNRILRTYSFIQRKSATYVTNPVLPAAAQNGAIVAYLGKNDGASWDSTLIFSNGVNWSRYPQGAIYNPPGNTTYTNAYVVGSGPCTSAANSWVGSWFASKQITSPGTNSATADQQFIPNTSPFNNATSPAMKKQDFPRYSFSATDDGMVRSLGAIYNDVNNTTSNAIIGFRGAALNKGVFNSGVFVWSYDSFIPPVVARTVVDVGSKSMWGTPYMAWNDAGTVGYVMFIGSRTGSTGRNVGWQPVIYKTTNSGNSWVVVNGIDFNSASTYSTLLNSMNGPNTNTAIEIPFFKADEGIDLAVDNNNKLHITGMAVGSARAHPDSVEYTWQYPKGTENMSWPYINTAWPYLFDFSGDGTTTWAMKIIDSLGTEGPSSTSGQPGFGSNPWSNQSQANPVSSDSRIQISRSYDGEFMLYSWAESDTSITTGATKWNEFPNVHQRALRLCDGAVSLEEFTVTAVPTQTLYNSRIRDKSYFHFMGSTAKAGGSTATAATFTVPYTISNNVVTDGGVSVDNYFTNFIAVHNFPTSACGATVATGLAAAKTEASQSFIYPNPTDNKFNVRLNLVNANDISVEVYNAIGQKVSETKVNGQIGENNVPMNMNNANAGIYFVKVKVGKTESTKKLVVE